MTDRPSSLTRREFINHSAKTTASLAAVSALPFLTAKPACAGVGGANDRINLAIIGIRSRGRSLAKIFAAIPKVQVKTLCDVDANLFDERVKLIESIQGSAPNTQTDMRRVFEDKNIDAVVVAAPNHWHALASIWAMQAGKHVYLEKPTCHNIWEGRKTLEAARKYNRICQAGFQCRTKPGCQSAIKFLHDGGIGEVYMARVLCLKPRDSLGRCPDGPAPSTGPGYDFFIWGEKGPRYDSAYLSNVDYDMWLVVHDH